VSAATLIANRIIDEICFGAASLLAIVDICAKVAPLYFSYLVVIKGANRDIGRLQGI
jgi:hypothetical protein